MVKQELAIMLQTKTAAINTLSCLYSLHLELIVTLFQPHIIICHNFTKRPFLIDRPFLESLHISSLIEMFWEIQSQTITILEKVTIFFWTS